jgi:3-phosphoshikimate 1-carboxyvinyltransferase
VNKTSEALSPWGMPPAERAVVKPLKERFNKELSLPGSKSYTNRALILAAIAQGTSTLRSPLFSDDSYWCTNALQRLGVETSADRAEGIITVKGVADQKLKLADLDQLPYIGSAGTIARFLPGVVAAIGEGEIVLTSSEQLASRPVAEMIRALRQLGAQISMEEDLSFPMTIQGGSLQGGEAQISGSVSSQFISGILIAAPLAKEPVTLKVTDHIVQSDYVRITLSIMKEFGVHVDCNSDLTEFHIQPQTYQAQDTLLEADASTATYFFALAAASQSEITITNLNPNTLQPDFGFIDHLKTLGCQVSVDGTRVTLKGPEKIQGDKLFDFNPCADSTPAMATIAPFASGSIEVRNVAHIRVHECDRISVLADHLKLAGIEVEEFDDGLCIKPGAPSNIVVNPHDDHRMAMSFAVMGALGDGVSILDPSCVSKTCSEYFDLLPLLGVETEVI